MTTAKIKLGQTGMGNVVIDGVDIAGSVTAMTVDVQAGHTTEATIRLGRVELEADTQIRIDDRTRTALLKLGWTPPQPKAEEIGDAVVRRLEDGTVVVERADDTILVSPECLAEMEKLGNYVDNVFTLDTAGEYRYRYAGDMGPNAIFERIKEEAPA